MRFISSMYCPYSKKTNSNRTNQLYRIKYNVPGMRRRPFRRLSRYNGQCSFPVPVITKSTPKSQCSPFCLFCFNGFKQRFKISFTE